jgi:membrane-associated phospholipid phosphatase
VRRQKQANVAGPRPDSAGESAVTADLPRVTPPPVLSPAAAAVVWVAAGVTFALLTVWVARQGPAVPAVDEHVHRWVISRRSPGSVAFARAVTWGGVTTVVLPALFVVGAMAVKGGRDVRRRFGSGLLLLCVASAGVYAELRINALVGRARPAVADWAGTAAGSSFPSGHTTNATLFAALCAWAIAAQVHAGWPRRAVWAGAVVYAAAVGWSRVWLGVHWPTDVIGGWLYGLAWFAGSIAVILTLRRWSAHRRAARSKGVVLPASEAAAKAVPPGAAVRVVDHPVQRGCP